MSFVSELKRRHVIRMGLAYLVMAWGVAQVAQLILDTYEAPAWIMQLVLVALGVGFPIALVLSWIFDLRWDGLHRESETEPAVLPIEDTSIAVLPFVDMSENKDQEYFSDGIAEELLNLLAKIPELHVAARTSSFSFRDSKAKIGQIGRELGVAHVLEGSVRKSGDTLRITAQLISTDKGYHLWSETWDRSMEDIFAVQDEIAGEVVSYLKLHLLNPTPSVLETDPDAYALYLQARYEYRKQEFELALKLLDSVSRINPAYAPAIALRSQVFAQQANYGLRKIDEGYKFAREAAFKALSIDPNCASAYSGLGWIAMNYDLDLPQAAHYYQEAIARNPNDVELLRDAANLVAALGRLALACEINEYVATRDPANPAIHNNLGAMYFYRGFGDKAIESCRTALRLSPGRIGMQYMIAMALLALDKAAEALNAGKQETYEGFRLSALSMAHHRLGNRTESNAALNYLIENEEREFPYNIALIFAFRDEVDHAFEWLDKAVNYHDGGLSMVLSEPGFGVLHKDPRWTALLERIGMLPDRLDAIAFKVVVPQ